MCEKQMYPNKPFLFVVSHVINFSKIFTACTLWYLVSDKLLINSCSTLKSKKKKKVYLCIHFTVYLFYHTLIHNKKNFIHPHFSIHFPSLTILYLLLPLPSLMLTGSSKKYVCFFMTYKFLQNLQTL